MTNLRVQLNESFKHYLENEFSDSFMEDLTQKCLKILRDRVPVDTHALQEDGITGVHYKEGDSFVIDLSVNNLTHPSSRTLRMGALGLILNLSDKRRSQSQPKNPAGSTTAGWWDEAINDIEEMIKSGS